MNVSARFRVQEPLLTITYLNVPPPIRCPHFIVYPPFPLLVTKQLLRCMVDELLKRWVAEQLTNTFNWIAPPQFNIFCLACPILIEEIPLDFPLITDPAWSNRKLVETL